jgi:hypothetical protein
MMKLSRMLLFAAIGSLALAVWSLATFPIIKFSTESIVNGRLAELIDRSQLTNEELESLDVIFEFLIGNDRQWRTSHHRLNTMAIYGFLACATVFAFGAARAHGLEKRAAFPWLTT